MAMSVRPFLAVRRSRPASPTPACASRTGPRWSSASGCAWTAPISAPPPSGRWARQTGVRRGRHQAAAGGLRSHLQELRRRAREALPATRIRPLGTCPASSKPTRRMRWITRAVLQPTSAAGAPPRPLWCGSA